MRSLILALTGACLLLAGGAAAQVGELRVKIHEPVDGLRLPKLPASESVEVVGGASIFGGVEQLDLLFVIDTSKSLLKTDPRDYRSSGAIGLVRGLHARSDIQIGVVDFDANAEIIQPLTPDRGAAIQALRKLDRHGATDLAEGIQKALAGLAERARPDSSRVILLFTDGKSDEDDAREAARMARAQGAAIHTLLLGSDSDGDTLLREIAETTGGSFLRVTDPRKLPEAFLNLRTTGVEKVALRINGAPPVPARLSGGTFSGRAPLRMGDNEIVAIATSLDGAVREARATVTVSGPLHVTIDSPDDGTEYDRRVGETWVEGVATVFGHLPEEELAGIRDHGVSRVLLRVGDSPPFATTLENGRFRGRVLLGVGESRIVATAVSHDDRAADAVVHVRVKPPGCGELEVVAMREGRPALSISDRGVELVFDASNSMWGRMDGKPKIEVAREVLRDLLTWLPEDLGVALRAYGHRRPREARDCGDTELLVPFGTGDRAAIRAAVDGLSPKGQTPLAHSLEQIAADFRGSPGERAVVLVTDGIESCGGDPAAAARALQGDGPTPVHVIGFGIGTAGEEDPAGLRAIAEASGGRYIAARSAAELREALSVTVGTAFAVEREGALVAEGTLGADQSFSLPAGDYVVKLASQPPHAVPVSVSSEEGVTVVLQRKPTGVDRDLLRRPVEYEMCEEPPRIAGSEPSAAPPAAMPRRD